MLRWSVATFMPKYRHHWQFKKPRVFVYLKKLCRGLSDGMSMSRCFAISKNQLPIGSFDLFHLSTFLVQMSFLGWRYIHRR